MGPEGRGTGLFQASLRLLRSPARAALCSSKTLLPDAAPRSGNAASGRPVSMPIEGPIDATGRHEGPTQSQLIRDPLGSPGRLGQGLGQDPALDPGVEAGWPPRPPTAVPWGGGRWDRTRGKGPGAGRRASGPDRPLARLGSRCRVLRLGGRAAGAEGDPSLRGLSIPLPSGSVGTTTWSRRADGPHPPELKGVQTF